MKITEIIGILFGIFTVISVAGKWLLADWHKKKLKIQELEARNQKAMFDKIDKDLNALGDKSRRLQDMIRGHNTDITKVSAKLEVMAGILNTSLHVSKAINSGKANKEKVESKLKDLKEDLKKAKDE